MADQMPNPSGTPFTPILAPPRIQSLLVRLHNLSLSQERSDKMKAYWEKRNAQSGNVTSLTNWTADDDVLMRDQLVALDPDKSAFVYMMARAVRAQYIVEFGTSHGVSTIYLGLAVSQNVSAKREAGDKEASGRVVAAEMEPEKVIIAKKYWKEAGPEVDDWITLLEGDLREKIPSELERMALGKFVDMVLIDIWAPMALPSLKAVLPYLRPGALIVADNTGAAHRYTDFLGFLRDPVNGFRTMTTPFKGGLEVSVYIPS